MTEANSVVAENDIGSSEVDSQDSADKGEWTRFQCEFSLVVFFCIKALVSPAFCSERYEVSNTPTSGYVAWFLVDY